MLVRATASVVVKVSEGLPHAAFEQRAQDRAVHPGEPGVVGQFTEDRAIVLDEGRNRHIRRMMEGIGVEVLRLVRVAIGPLQLGDLAKGAYRPLSGDEKKRLDHAVRGNTW